MATTVTSTIGPTGDYTTLQAWEDAAPANLVTSDQVWKGVVQVGASFSSAGNLITIAGSTSDATRYKELTVAATGAWCDSTSNKLAYLTASGAYIVNSAGYSDVISITEDYARVSRLQLRATVNSTRAISVTGTGVILDSLIASTAGYNALYLAGSNGLVKNSLFTQTGIRGSDTGACAWFDVGSSGSKVLNCTAAYPGGSHTNTGFINNNYSNITFKNSVAVGYADGFNKRSSSSTYSGCYQDTTGTSYSGLTNSLAFTTSTFGDVGSSTPDLRLVSGSALIDTGTTDTDAATDPYGTARPSGSSYDVGAMEYVAAGDTTAPVLTSPVGTQTGSTTATIGATTDEGNGTMYGYVSTSATPPSDADLKAGTGAVWAGSATVSSTGANTLNATGLTASTGYYAHLLHTDAAANDSNTVTSAQFTTAAGAGASAKGANVARRSQSGINSFGLRR